ncbi:CHASE2 domain-containing protein [Palleronia pelagia]|uniref:CHASE2 domain-containing protein n=1 Tax=Palleronia pelagia TaxID=387096 RepID=UPI0015873616|nr:adenylate/guanylate cyclase domain-containing protein [Palleronia pelagia]
MRRRWRRWRGPAVGGLLALLTALALSLWHPGARTEIGAGLEGRLLDLRFQVRGHRPSPDSTAIVVFDDRAVAGLETFPPSRSDIARTVHALFDGGAAVVALDLLLVDPRPDDATLAQALDRGETVLGVAEAPAGHEMTGLIDPAGFGLVIGADPIRPLPSLGPTAELQGHAALGHVTVKHDTDGALRRMRPALTLLTPDGTQTLPGLGVAAASAVGRRPEIVLPGDDIAGRLSGDWPVAWLDTTGALPLNFYGPGGAIPTHSAGDLEGADLVGRVVFLGATATGFGDRHATSFDPVLPGVEAHATLAANLLAGETLRRDLVAWCLGGGLAISLALAGYWAGGRRRPALFIIASVSIIVLALLVLQVAFARGWWLDATTVLSALLCGLAIGGTRRVLETRRRAATLARFQSPRLVEAIASQADSLGNPLPREAVVVFVDVAGFTSIAERVGPTETAQFLRRFHELVEAAAEPQGGAIMDFAGDGVLVVFGVPTPTSDEATRALRFIDRLLDDANRQGLVLRSGAHFGPVELGILGGLRHRTVAISGDVVNIASRLQDAAKRMGASFAASADFVAALDDRPAAGLEPAGELNLRGRAAPVSVWVRPVEKRVGSLR